MKPTQKLLVRYFLSGALLFLFSANLFSQVTEISGTVKDKISGHALAGANVVVEGTGSGAMTDQNGKFRLDIPDGKYVISVSFIGYEIAKKSVEISGQPLPLNFALKPTVIPGQEVVVTGTRAVARKTPVAFVDVPRTEIQQRYWAQDVPMLLSEVPGIYAYSDAGNGIGYTYLKIRGFDQKRVSVMINGIPLNDPEDHQVYWVDMPDLLASVHDVQIQRGVGSSLYGTSSFGGTVNIQTTQLNMPRQILATTGFGSYNTQKYSLNLHSGLIDNQYAISARFSKVTTDGYRDNSAVDMWSYFLSAARYTLNTSTFINIYGGSELTHAAWEASPESELKKNHRHNPYTYKNAVDNFSQPHYELHHQWSISDNLSWNNSLYYIHGEGYYENFKSNKKLYDFGLEPFYLPDSTLVKRTNLVRQKWVEKNHRGVISKLDWEHKNGSFSAGIDGYLFDSNHWGKIVWAAQLPPGTNPEDNYYQYGGDKKMITFFVHELYRLNKKTTLMADLNWQLQKYQFEQKEVGHFRGADRHFYEVKYSFFNPRVGVNYNMTEKINVFANISTAHREPSDDDLFDIWQGPDDIGVAPLFSKADTVKKANGKVDHLQWSEPLTKPESLLDFELGAGYSGSEVKFKLNAYWMDFRNEIVPYSQVDKDGFPIKGNADHTTHRGVEGNFALKLGKGFTLSGAAALSQNYFKKFTQYEAEYDADWNFVGTKKIDFNGKTIAGFPGTMANLRLSYNNGGFASHIFFQLIGKQYLDNNELDERSISAYSLLNLYFSYRLQNFLGLSGLKFNFWLNNALDKKYETAGYYDSWYGENYLWPGAERNFFVGIETEL
ncbi:MAG: TonB-dependent receptor [Calditrichaeota bacterium]|nr:TonB-dependent receptor [Calditrichota bacterium]